ncbi:MAG: metallophosphoesterase [Lachnospirales bacterium]
MSILKKEVIPLTKSLPFYIISLFFTSFMMWQPIVYFCGNIAFVFFISLYITVNLFYPISTKMTQYKFKRLFDAIGIYVMSFQITFTIAAFFDLFLKIILVFMFKMEVEVYVYVSAMIYFLTLTITIFGAINAQITYDKSYTITFNKLRDNLHIVHLSDLHIGSITNFKKIDEIVRRVNEKNPDIICITGDTFTENLKDITNIEKIADILNRLKSKYGTYACLGNHDAGRDFEEIVNFFESANIKLLCDEYIEFDDFNLIGRLDVTPAGFKAERKSIFELTELVSLNKLNIVLDHQPKELLEIAETGVDLTLSGHTHGGQFFPLHIVIKWFFPHYRGVKKIKDMYSVICSGTCSAMPPIRIGSKSELVSIYIK